MSVVNRSNISRLTLCWVACAILSSDVLRAQEPASAEDEARNQLGTFSFTPGLVLSGGYDTNPTREVPAVGGPELYAVPQAEVFWRLGSFRVSGAGAQEFVNGSPAINYRTDAHIEYRGPRFEPSVTFERPRTYARPTGFEIGQKSRRVENRLNAGIKAELTARTHVAFSYNAVDIGYDADAIYATSSLRDKLNRHTNAVLGAMSYKVTPLTTVSVNTEFTDDQFKYSPERNGSTRRVSGAVDFASPAVIVGSASIGHMTFTSPFSGAAAFSGLIFSSQLSYLNPAGVLSLRINRDLQYSYDVGLSYYLLTDTTLSFSRTIVGPWHGLAYGGEHLLDYRPAGTQESSGRVDHVFEAGGALAYQVSVWSRVGVSVEYYTKDGVQPFSGVRAVAFLTYGKHFERLDRPIPFDQ